MPVPFKMHANRKKPSPWLIYPTLKSCRIPSFSTKSKTLRPLQISTEGPTDKLYSAVTLVGLHFSTKPYKNSTLTPVIPSFSGSPVPTFMLTINPLMQNCKSSTKLMDHTNKTGIKLLQ